MVLQYVLRLPQTPHVLTMTFSLPDVFDGAMVVIAMYLLNIFHPALLLAKVAKDKWRLDQIPLAFKSSLTSA